ncbi:hypothetical protein [Streptomyces sp. NBC_00690]|uniref:hypothetical protein n=1 Tax=Streptomyces sp. NBC_00690 TaxID=2975808 RepID=UPI002E2B3896|nr:hypothetical protein [Streptomyces sp. NBC_00690]
MRPGRFQEFVIGLAEADHTAITAKTLAETGESSVPCGFAITVADISRWGVVGQLPDGAKHTDFEDTPVHGDPIKPQDPPQATDPPEQWLAALLAQSGSAEIAEVERWSTREEARPGYFGVTVRFHNAARVFVRLL